MTTTVFIWRPNYLPGDHFSVGHASIQINNTYVSWFPDKHALKDAISSPALRHTMRQDIDEEKRMPSFVSSPIPGLDEGRMGRWASMIMSSGPSVKSEFEDVKTYRLLTTSCAGLVIRALLVGKKLDGGLIQRFLHFAPQPLDCEIFVRALTRDAGR